MKIGSPDPPKRGSRKKGAGDRVQNNIDTIFFDVGATLRYVVEDPEFAAAAEKELMELVGATESHDEFFEAAHGGAGGRDGRAGVLRQDRGALQALPGLGAG